MLRKIAGLISLFVLFAWLSPASAARPNYAPELPEKSGTYDVPGHPNLKVKVFVHKAKPAKPAPGPTSMETCDLPDPSSSAVVDGAGWVIPDGTWTYHVNPLVPSTIKLGLDSIISNSFDAWTSIPKLSSVNLVRSSDTSANRATFDGQNIIAWGRTSGSALGVTYIWYRDGVALELDTIMNKKFSWSWGGGTKEFCAWTNTYDAQNILTHELGHWFGLDDHYTSGYVDNTMYGYGSKAEIKKDTPELGDIAGINTIY